MIVGANLPDVDVLAYFAGPQADLEWRRGWTHGVLALLVLPLALTGFLLLLHRASRGRLRQPAPLVPKQLLLLSTVAIVSHPVLDTLNTYGLRWLMPFSARWFYGDTLFIIDPWVWIALALGAYYSGRRQRAKRSDADRPARWALALAVTYACAMALSGRAARTAITRELVSLSGKPVQRVMAGPAPIDPFERSFVVEQEGEYRVGTFSWLKRPHIDPGEVMIYPRGGPSHPAFHAAVTTEPARRFLGWARFPTFEIETVGAGEYLVHLVDLRYARDPGDSFGALSIRVRVASALDPSPSDRASSSTFALARRAP